MEDNHSLYSPPHYSPPLSLMKGNLSYKQGYKCQITNFILNSKRKLLKFNIFFFHVHFFYSLKFSIFYSFFIRIKVKHPNLENKKLRELLKFNLLSLHVHLIFPTKTFSLNHYTTFKHTFKKEITVIAYF